MEVEYFCCNSCGYEAAESKIKEWESRLESWKKTSINDSVIQATWMIKGLKLALKIINEENNKKLNTNARQPGERSAGCYCGTKVSSSATIGNTI